MLSAANNEDPCVESIEESQLHQSQREEAILDENNVSVCRSTRWSSKSSCPPGISDYPLPKILEVLFIGRKCLTAAISHQRSQIIAGDDVNLVKILLVPEKLVTGMLLIGVMCL